MIKIIVGAKDNNGKTHTKSFQTKVNRQIHEDEVKRLYEYAMRSLNDPNIINVWMSDKITYGNNGIISAIGGPKRSLRVPSKVKMHFEHTIHQINLNANNQ